MESDIPLLLLHSSSYVQYILHTGAPGRSSHSCVTLSAHYAPEEKKERTRTLDPARTADDNPLHD